MQRRTCPNNWPGGVKDEKVAVPDCDNSCVFDPGNDAADGRRRMMRRDFKLGGRRVSAIRYGQIPFKYEQRRKTGERRGD